MNKIKFSSMEDDKELVIYGDCIESSNYLSKSLENPSTITGIGEKSKQITVKYNGTTITIPITNPMYGISLTNCNYSNDKLERQYTGIRLLSDEIRVTKDKVIYKRYIHKMEITENTRMNSYTTNLHMGILVDSNVEPIKGDAGDFIKYCIMSPQFKTGSGPNEVCLWALWSGDSQHINIKSNQLTGKFNDNDTRTAWIKEYNSTHSIPLTLYYGTHGPLETQDLTDTEYGQKLIALLPQLTSAPEVSDGTNKVSIEMRNPGIIEATKFVEPIFAVDPILENNDLETIKKIAQAGLGANYWNVGDKYPVKLNGTISKTTFNNETYYAFIIGFNHNPEYEGEHSIHFQFAMDEDGRQIAFTEGNDGYFTGFVMNTTETNINGWKNSYMRQTLMPQFLNLLPDEWQSVITETKKYTDNVGGGSGSIQENITSTNDKVFLLSEFEIFSTTYYVNSYEKNYQQQYTYYINSKSNDRIFYDHQSVDSAVYWQLRSPYPSNPRSFAVVSPYGNAYVRLGDQSCGLAPAVAIA